MRLTSGTFGCIASLFLAAACGGSDKPLQEGATVEGALHRSDASSSSLRVSVLPVGPSTSTDSTDHFLLESVPAGSVRLRFEGSGLVADLHVGVVIDGMKVVLDIRVSGAHAEAHAEVEFKGVIESIDVKAKTLVVSGVKVITSASTEIERADERIALSDLKVGERVEVEGVLQSDGSVLAREIEVIPPAQEKEVELEGIVESVTPPTLKVSGRTIVTNSATQIRRGDNVITLSDVKVGDRVHVRGKLQTDGSILARIIRVAPGFVPRVELEGIVDAVTPPNKLKVSGLTVATDARTVIERGHEVIALKDLKVGERVHVRGRPQPDGAILAIKIRVQGDDHF